MQNYSEQTLAHIVSGSYRAASVFEKYHLDFCCNGKRKLGEACAQRGISVDEVSAALAEVLDTHKAEDLDVFNYLGTEELIRFILRKHHFYVRQTSPQILAHLERVAFKHGEHHPYMNEVYTMFRELALDLDAHMEKEEKVLFPMLLSKGQNPMPQQLLDGPIHQMEKEHDRAGFLMEQIRILTDDFTPPAGACTTFRLVLQELQAFEEDLHRHVHLENNVLFQ